MAENLKQKTLKGLIWSGLERLSVQGVNFLIMILMARVISPEDYSIVGIVLIFIDISESLVDGGFSQALIRKRDRTQVDNSTVFFFNIAVGLLIYLIMFFSAPLIASFFHQDILTEIIRILSVIIIFNSLAVVQRAILTVDIDFKTQAKASTYSAIIAGIAGVTMAYTNFGIWAIVVYQIVNIFLKSGLLWVYSKWRPTLQYSWDSFKKLFGFGSKLAISGLINTLYNNLYQLVIAKSFRESDLGFYTRGRQFGTFLSSNITNIIQRVSYPVLCTFQDDEGRLRETYRRIIRLSAYIIFPLMIGLASLSHPLIITLLTDKWAFSADILQILSLSLMWFPIHALNLNILQVKGRSDLFLRLEIIKKVVAIIILVATLPFGLLAMCWGQVLNSIISLIINTHYSKQIIGLGLFKQLGDLLPSLLYSFSMWGIIYIATLFIPSNLIKLIVGITAGVAWYTGISYLTRSPELKELVSIISKKIRKR